MIIAPLDNGSVGMIFNTTGKQMVLTQEEYQELGMSFGADEFFEEEEDELIPVGILAVSPGSNVMSKGA